MLAELRSTPATVRLRLREPAPPFHDGQVVGRSGSSRGLAWQQHRRVTEELSKRIDDLHQRFDDLRGDINRRFDEVNQRFGDQRHQAAEFRAEVTSELREMRADMRAHFRWTVTTMVALFGLAVPVWMWFLSLILKIR